MKQADPASIPSLPPRPSTALAGAIVTAIVSAATLGSSSAQAKDVAPADAIVTVDVPGPLERKRRTENTLLGDVETLTVSGSAGDARLGIAVSKLPDASDDLTTDGMLYRQARRKILRRYDAERTSWQDCRVAGYTCRQLEYEAADGRHGVARLFLTEEMLVIVNGIYENDRDHVEAFHDSTRRSG